jgi:excisionase family DNA binding protein
MAGVRESRPSPAALDPACQPITLDQAGHLPTTLSVAAAAALLGVSRTTAYEAVHRKELPCVQSAAGWWSPPRRCWPCSASPFPARFPTGPGERRPRAGGVSATGRPGPARHRPARVRSPPDQMPTMTAVQVRAQTERMAPHPDPEVPERPRPPRTYPAAYKLRILAEYEQLDGPPP